MFASSWPASLWDKLKLDETSCCSCFAAMFSILSRGFSDFFAEKICSILSYFASNPQKNMQHIGPSKALRLWGETECRNQKEKKTCTIKHINFNMLLMFDQIVGNAARLKRTCSFDLETKNVSDTEKWAKCKYVSLYFSSLVWNQSSLLSQSTIFSDMETHVFA